MCVFNVDILPGNSSLSEAIEVFIVVNSQLHEEFKVLEKTSESSYLHLNHRYST